MNSGSTGEKLLSPPLDPSPFSVIQPVREGPEVSSTKPFWKSIHIWCILVLFVFGAVIGISKNWKSMHTFWCIMVLLPDLKFCCFLLVLLYAYLNLERMKSDTCFDVFRCILKSILILMQLYEPRDSPFCSIEVSELFTGNRSLTNTAQTEQTSIAAGKPLMTPVLFVRIKRLVAICIACVRHGRKFTIYWIKHITRQ